MSIRMRCDNCRKEAVLNHNKFGRAIFPKKGWCTSLIYIKNKVRRVHACSEGCANIINEKYPQTREQKRDLVARDAALELAPKIARVIAIAARMKEMETAIARS